MATMVRQNFLHGSDCTTSGYNQCHKFNYTVSLKNVPPLTCYNLDIPDPITILFGRRVTK